ncbi:GNAT family N-acetyltransferase [Halorussus sp. MSC15.2]|uniref:GNAT family N-acetyltransferase n=1 Tax=Halorussus sp. MSC15.2 TaxID=2283638 RepID=UPI0013D2C349|nr:GNAT family N-acetyltransferase [Halorussus sp. MSC15.2]NEU56419.1 GNAT family N-acetyltransferase [Halorussus sp. MSC15.2]
MAADLTLRAATVAETEAIFVVHVAAIVAHGPSAYTDKQVAAWAAKAEGTERYVDAIEDPSTELVVAESGDCVVGFGELDVENGGVEAVFVDPERNGEGIGSSILNHFEQRLRNEGFDVVRLRAVLNAVGFYERQGYERVERVTTTTTNDVDVDSVRMEKPL